jgi:hypothetical protein
MVEGRGRWRGWRVEHVCQGLTEEVRGEREKETKVSGKLDGSGFPEDKVTDILSGENDDKSEVVYSVVGGGKVNWLRVGT